MSRRSLLASAKSAAVSLGIGVLVTLGSVDGALGDSLPFGVGELCEFSIDYGVINAGESSLEVKEMIEYDGHPCYHLRTRARSNRFFSAVFRVRDQADSFMDADSLYTRYFTKHLREADFRRDLEIHFDHPAQMAYYADGRENDIVSGVHDVLTAFFWVRAQELTPGAEFEFATYGDTEMYELRVKVHRTETIDSPVFGEIDCVVVQPYLVGDGLFKHEGDLLIWLTNDGRHVPVRVSANVPVGSISATLKNYRPPTPVKSED